MAQGASRTISQLSNSILPHRSIGSFAGRGFTIVELLIVVVVIAILASITIVSYNGITARAEKAKTLVVVQNLLDALSIYKISEGSYPTTATYCLGAGYTDRTGDSVPDCRWNSGNINPNTAFNTALRKYMDTEVNITQRPVTSGTSGVVGAYFMNDANGTLNGTAQRDWLVYAVPDKDCGRTVPDLTNTYPQFVSKADNTPSEDWGNGGLCFVPLE